MDLNWIALWSTLIITEGKLVINLGDIKALGSILHNSVRENIYYTVNTEYINLNIVKCIQTDWIQISILRNPFNHT